ncbi:MAG: hypothetical protein ACRDF7_04465 [Candidatus Limnocylindrales bacterium]
MPRSLVRLGLALALGLLLAGCGSGSATMPPPTPADDLGIFAQWALDGVSVFGRTSGDPGCDDATLVDNAIHVVVSLGAYDSHRDVYLFRFRDSVRWADGGAAVDACRGQFEARSARAGGAVERVDVSPYRAFGDGWSPALRGALLAGLTVAAGDGGVPTGGDVGLTPQPTRLASP